MLDLQNFNKFLDKLPNDLANDVNAESICALRCALIDFLDDIEKLYGYIKNS